MIFGDLVVAKLLNTNPRMHNLYTKFAKILEICKQLSDKLVNEKETFLVVVQFLNFRIWKLLHYLLQLNLKV